MPKVKFKGQVNEHTLSDATLKLWQQVLGVEPEYIVEKQKHIDPGEYHYFADFVVSLGARADTSNAVTVSRIWADGELVYNLSTGLNKPGFSFKFFDGNENQGEVYRGMHYRGQMVLLFEDLDLSPFGDSIPAISAELIDGAGASGASVNNMLAYDGTDATVMQLDADKGILWKLTPYNAGAYASSTRIAVLNSAVSKRVVVGSGVVSQSTGLNETNDPVNPGDMPIVCWFDELGVAFATNRRGSLSPQVARLFKLDSGTAPEIDSLNLPLADASGTSFGQASNGIGFRVTASGKAFYYVIMAGQYTTPYLQIARVKSDSIVPLWAEEETTPAINMPSFLVGRQSEGFTELYYYDNDTIRRLTVRPVGTFVTNEPFYTAPVGKEVQSAYYDKNNDRVVCVIRDGGASDTGYVASIDNAGTVVWTSDVFNIPLNKGVNVHDQEGTADLTNGSLVLTQGLTPNRLTYININDGEVYEVILSAAYDPTKVAIWNSRENKLYRGPLDFVQMGVPTGNSSYPLSNLLKAYGVHVGFDELDIETTRLDDIDVKGYVVSSGESYSDLLSILGQVYGFNWHLNYDKVQAKYPYDSSGELVIDYVVDADRVLYINTNESDDSNPKLQMNTLGDGAIPSFLQLNFFDIDADYNRGQAQIERSTGPMETSKSDSELEITLSLSATGNEAQGLLYSMLSRFWETRNNYSYRLTSEAIALLPVDVVQFTVNETTYQVMLDTVRINGDFSVSVTATSIAGAAYPARVEAQPTPSVTNAFNPARGVLLDLPDLSPGWTEPGVYNLVAVVGGYVPGAFRGAVIEAEGTQGWGPLVNVGPDAEGYLATLLDAPGVWAHPFELDTFNSVVIKQDNVPSSLLVGVDDTALEGGANLIALVTGSTAELVQFKDAAEISPGVWRLYNLLRGRFGTENNIGLAVQGTHVAFMSRIELVQYGVEELVNGAIIDYRARTPRQTLEELSIERVSPQGNSRKPYAPVDLFAYRNGSNGLFLDWTRRARYFNTPFEPLVPSPTLDENEARFRIEFYTDSLFTALIGTLDIDGETPATISAADQSNIGLTATETTIYVKFYQLTDDDVEVGFGGEHVLTVFADGAIPLSATMSLGGTTTVDVTIPEDAGTISATMALGGTMRAAVTNTKNISATMVLGGEMSLNIYEPLPQLIGADMALGGAMETEVIKGAAISATMQGGGDMVANVNAGVVGFEAILVDLSTDMAATTSIAAEPVVYDNVVYNTGSFTLNGSGEIVIPSGVSNVAIIAGVFADNNLSDSGFMYLNLNGSTIANSMSGRNNGTGGFSGRGTIIEVFRQSVSPGDTISVTWSKSVTDSFAVQADVGTFLNVVKVD